MSKNQIYIGLDKDNVESLYYEYGVGVYLDLLTKEIKAECNLQLDTFVPYSTLIKRSLKEKRAEIIKNYLEDRVQPVTTAQVYLGDIYKVLGFITGQDENGDSKEYGLREIFKKDALLTLANDNEGVYGGFIDIEDNIYYPYPFEIQVGDYYIPEGQGSLRLFAKIANLEEKVGPKEEKGKVLYQYRKYKENKRGE